MLMLRIRETFDPANVTTVGPEEARNDERNVVDRVWKSVADLYRVGTHPAISICIRHRGRIVLNRAIGHASGNAPTDLEGTARVPATPDTPFCIFSASKAITAMVIHMLDDRGLLHVDDRVAEYIPEFAQNGKAGITLKHVLCHRAGIPSIGDEQSVDLLYDWEGIVQRLCEATPVTSPGRQLAYHAITGGYVLGEVVRRVTGDDIRIVLQREILDPLGFKGLNYGISADRIGDVAVNAFTGHPVVFPISAVAKNALGVPFEEACRISNDAAFLTNIIPSGNIVSTAEEVSKFFEMLRLGGELNGTRVFAPRTVHRAVNETAYRQMDFTLLLPVRYGVGLMLGSNTLSAFGRETPRAFGHLGFINNLGWADPERALSVGLLTSGKPFSVRNLVGLVKIVEAIRKGFQRSETM
jgi:CubicO group peptidase (beta-lactamase class C family)